MKTIIKTNLLIILVIIMTSGISLAQYGGGESHDGQGYNSCKTKGGYCKLPNLTDDQETQIKNLKLKFLKEKMILTNHLNEKKAHLKTLETSENPDINDINTILEEIYAIKLEIARKKAALTQEIRKILNEEQRLIFDLRRIKGSKAHGCMSGGRDGQGNGKCCPGNPQNQNSDENPTQNTCPYKKNK